ncbi:MAG TPA: CpsB/CapC family capsule biosynthesis tyrosine phosphatase [Thermoanaerobaculaceae bacterium]|nr:CpsB/CapC family capsule biosynthesis tyrosine phosphatase [Thermoanaerobaculaceae bacterium]
MVDLHAHLLPGVDDGAEELADAVRMCEVAAADGITAAVATPHQRHEWWPNDDRDALVSRFETLLGAVGRTIELSIGAEIRVDSELLAEVDRLPDGSLLPMAGSRYLLLELPPMRVGPDPRAVVHELAVGGWRPVLAHPERIAWLAEEPASLAELVERGALLQLTAMSVTGAFGKRARECCAFLLDNDLAHFVASDAHDASKRPPVLSDAFRIIAEGWGEAHARRLTDINPRAVLEDRPIAKDVA